MSKLPDIYEMEPGEWEDAVTELADTFVDAISEALNRHTDAAALYQELRPLIEPYLIDEDDEMLSDQFLVQLDGERVKMGQAYDLSTIAYDAARKHWWYADLNEDPGDESPEDIHLEIAERAVCTTGWGNQRDIDFRVGMAERDRALFTPYVHAIEDALQTGDPTAAELRPHLVALLNASAPKDSPLTLQDRSSDEHLTHLELVNTDGTVLGHVVALTPGSEIDTDALAKRLGLNDENELLIATDHLSFEGALVSVDDARLRLPSQKDTDVGEYYWRMTQVSMSLTGMMHLD